MKTAQNQKAKVRSGFTLIELLVVVAIISLLSTLAILSLSNKQSKARDSKRKADISLIRSALEMYNLANQVYPNSDCEENPPGSGVWLCTSTSAQAYWIPNLNGYISPPPRDPGHHSVPALDVYVYMANVTDLVGRVHKYVLYYMLENGSQDNQCNIGPTAFPPQVPNPVVWSTRCSD